MSTRDVLRTFVVKTNSYWPFSWCNRVPYTLAIRALMQAFGKCPEVRSMWLCHDQWVPAMSDIDSWVVFKHGLTVEQEYDFLESFWKTFDRLRRFFPMLDVRILSENELPTSLPYVNSWHPDLRPVLLHGAEGPALATGCSPMSNRFALSFALSVYVSLLPPCFAVPDSFLRRLDVQRRVRKILRLLKPVLSEAGQCRGLDELSRVAEAILAIESAVAHLDSIAPSDHAEPGWLQGDADGLEYSPDGFPALDGVRSVIRTGRGQVLIIAENGLEAEVLDHIIEASHQQWPGGRDAPVVLPFRVFAYLIRTNDPYSYSELLSKRIIAFGEDPLEEMTPPGRGAFAAYTLGTIADTLIFTRGERVFSRSRPLKLGHCKWSLDQAMAARMLLRDDWISPHRPEIAARWRSEFPECAVAFEQIKGHAAEGRDKTAREALFHLFRPIARDILDRIGSIECGPAAVAAGRFGEEAAKSQPSC